MDVRFATLEDVLTIRRIAEITWPPTYSSIISAEQIEYMLNWMYSTTAIEQAIRSNDQAFLVLENEGKALGFAGIQWNAPEAHFCRIHKLYVRPETQGTGAGKALLNTIETIAREKHCSALHLNVNKANSAVGFYKHNGFDVYETTVLDIGNGFVMDDYIMTKHLE